MPRDITKTIIGEVRSELNLGRWITLCKVSVISGISSFSLKVEFLFDVFFNNVKEISIYYFFKAF